MPTLLLVNPTAGHGRAGRLAAEAERACRQQWGDVRVARTGAPGDGVALVREAATQGCDRVLALGGDGTVHEAANGILAMPPDQRPALGVIPVGTGNDYAKLSGTYGQSVRQAIHLLARAQVTRLDVGLAWREYFINSIGIGFDAEVARRVAEYHRLRGTVAYLAAALKTFRAFTPPRLRVEAQGVSFEEEILLLEVGIGAIVGGGFRLTPEARPDDGLFDVCSIRRQGVLGFALKLPLAMVGRHAGLDGVRMFRTDRLTVSATGGAPLVTQLDGELRTGPGPLEITQSPAALPVLMVRPGSR
jgi:YegS/Rv2252/BmrU family lipid kinase